MNVENFTDLYMRTVSDRRIIGILLSGHLAIEYLLRQLIKSYDPALIKLSKDLTFARLISLNLDIGTINLKQYEVLYRINKIRNKFAHEITYEVAVDELIELFKLASGAFTDMTDGISQGLDALEKCTNICELEDYALAELCVQIAYDLHEEYQARGGDIEEF